jgi:hypothetical protein
MYCQMQGHIFLEIRPAPDFALPRSRCPCLRSPAGDQLHLSGWNLTLVPSLDGGDDFVGVGGPREWLIGVGLSDEAVDGRLEIDGAEDTTFQSTSAELGEKALS